MIRKQKLISFFFFRSSKTFSVSAGFGDGAERKGFSPGVERSSLSGLTKPLEPCASSREWKGEKIRKTEKRSEKRERDQENKRDPRGRKQSKKGERSRKKKENIIWTHLEKNYHAHIPTIFIAGLSHFSCISLMSTLEQQGEYGHDNFFPGESK